MRCARTNCGPVLDSRSSTGQGRCVLFRVGWGTLFHSASSHPACKFSLDSSNTRATKKLSWTSVVLFPIIAPTYLSACNPKSGKKERKIITLWFYCILSVLPTEYIGVIRGIFVGSAFLWITGSLVSKSKLKLQWVYDQRTLRSETCLGQSGIWAAKNICNIG